MLHNESKQQIHSQSYRAISKLLLQKFDMHLMRTSYNYIPLLNAFIFSLRKISFSAKKTTV
jgi:hypothetical protein